MENRELKATREAITEDTFAASIWTRYDVESFLADHGIPATKANIDAILTPEFIDGFYDRLNELGYEVMDALIDPDELPDKAE